MGRIWTLLYLSRDPLPAAELGERLQMSSGAVSMALSELEKWGAVSRSWVPGERRDFFLAEPSVWKMVARVLGERELSIVRDFRGSLRAAIDALGKRATSDSRADAHKLARLRQLEALAKTGETLLAALVSGAAVDPQLLNDPILQGSHDSRP